MQDTCKKPACHLWKKYQEACPNYIKSEWRNEESGELRLIHDCAPVRTMIMLSEIYNKIIGVQKAAEQTRNALSLLRGAVTVSMAELGCGVDSRIELLEQK